MINLKEQVLDISRQNQIGDLSPWFDSRLEKFINVYYREDDDLKTLGNHIINKLKRYKEEVNISDVVIGMSGGVDSALTASLFKEAGWAVHGMLLPIHQNMIETARGITACEMLNIPYLPHDLTALYDQSITDQNQYDLTLLDDKFSSKIRRGNIRARLRMITLYNYAHSYNGLVASTDNYSELATGFWTLHGDVGDLSPIQSLLKSYEIPRLSKLWNVPEEIWRAKPTDGLGVSTGDEDQFGMSYLELDLMLLSMLEVMNNRQKYDHIKNDDSKTTRLNLKNSLNLSNDKTAKKIFDILTERMSNTWFKRMNPVNIYHCWEKERYIELENLDNDLFVPTMLKRSESYGN